MAWEKHYILQWYDLWNVKWTANLHTEDYSGEPEYLQGSGEAIVFEFRNDTDEIFGCLKPSSVILNIVCNSNFKFLELFTGGAMNTWVEIFQGEEDSSEGVPYWVGWLDPSDYQEPYEPVPYTMKLSCVDGLSLLKDILFASSVTSSEGEEEIVYYDGRQLISQILFDIFGQIGYSEFKEFVNIYEEEMLNSTDDSPFDQAKIDVDIFQDKYCDEVLKRILEPLNASIRQWEGVFCIYRPKELINDTVYGRHFTEAQSKSSISISPDQFFNRTGYNTNLKQIPGGIIGLIDPAKKVKLHMDYGYKESWISNYKFDAKLYTDPDWQGWTKVGGDYNKPIGNYVVGEKEGVAIIDQDVIPTSYIYQDFGQSTVISATDLILVEFEYGTFNPTSSEILNASISMEIYQTKHLHDVDGTELEWSSVLGASLTFLVTAPVGWSGWQTYRRQITGIEEATTIRIALYGDPNHTSDVYPCYKNIIFRTTSAKILAKEEVRTFVQRLSYAAGLLLGVWYFSKNKYYTVKTTELVDNIIEDTYITGNDIEGQEIERDYLLGDVVDVDIDNILEQFGGALSTVKRDSLSTAADNFYTEHNASYPGVVITTPGDAVVFTKVGGSFTGATSITNVTGNLSGVVVATQAYVPGVNKIIQVYPTDDTGSYDLVVTGCAAKTMTFDTDEETTCSNFVTAQSAYYSGQGFTLTYAQQSGGFYDGQWRIQFEGASDFEVTKENQVPTFDVLIITTQNYSAVVPAIHTISLTGNYGSANIVCDGVAAKDIEITEMDIPTVEWATREEPSSGQMKKLLQLIGDEIKYQYSRYTHRLTMNIQELPGELLSPASSNNQSVLSLLGNLQDSENQLSGVNRKFVITRGTFNVRSRNWKLDLVEIIND